MGGYGIGVISLTLQLEETINVHLHNSLERNWPMGQFPGISSHQNARIFIPQIWYHGFSMVLTYPHINLHWFAIPDHAPVQCVFPNTLETSPFMIKNGFLSLFPWIFHSDLRSLGSHEDCSLEVWKSAAFAVGFRSSHQVHHLQTWAEELRQLQQLTEKQVRQLGDVAFVDCHRQVSWMSN